MCGLTGFWSRSGAPESPGTIATRMSDALVHRGPDDMGIWCDEAAGLALAHRRLSILDLSPSGHQPMRSASGRWVIVFNGEIYNFLALRSELEAMGVAFRGRSDTEVLLAAVERWGVHEAVRRASGMFAFVLWDARDRTLHLGRDRAGEKPLYYGAHGATLLFGSELEALRRHPHWRGEVDRSVLALYLRHNYVPAPYSIFTGIRKVMPGTIVTVSEGRGETFAFEERAYWSARTVALEGTRDPLPGGDVEHTDALEERLRTVIGEQMIADVPLGAFLSGGVDSSVVVALMQAQSARRVRTFTIGFHETGFDEATHARAVADHLGTEHTELYVTPAEAREVIPLLPRIYDEPFADSSQIPTYLVARLARSRVTVSLSGDGGDELFAGYTHYRNVERTWARTTRLPRAARQLLGAGLGASAGVVHDVVAGVGLARRVPQVGHRLGRLAGLYRTTTVEGMHRQLVSHWSDPTAGLVDAREPDRLEGPFASTTPLASPLEQVMLLDFLTYVPDDVLVKVDRAAMAVSLETRAPMLDHRVVELAWRMPMSSKVRDGRGKHVLREVLYRHVPRTLVDRPKKGFGVPVGEWLRGPLRDWADDLLDPSALRAQGLLDARFVSRRWAEHRSGVQNWTSQLWPVLMFQAWSSR
ncbi:MAG TPA: asparagine synthase (glutamine-hydrolyzing) [Gemmatimonadaceae bacterium]|nr:asparagine synthase (glutamine-hydrolyzing) [Gemmatimonadaceae bacterium]